MDNSADTHSLCNQLHIKLDKISNLKVEATANKIDENVGKQKHEESLNISTLNDLIKQMKNEEFKYIVSNANHSNLINIGGNNLMHTAAATNNIPIIAFLFSSGFDIDTKNDLGQTPLHETIINRNFQATQLLLSLDANILIADNEGTSTFEMAFQDERHVPENIVLSFLQRFKRFGLSVQQMVDKLNRIGCSIHQALILNNAELTRVMLNQRNSIDRGESRVLLDRAMKSDYPENIEALLNSGPGAQERISMFVDTVKYHPNRENYLKKLLDENIVNPSYFLGDASFTFVHGSAEDIQMYLNIGYDEIARKQLGTELFVGLFAHCRLDYTKTIGEKIFDVNNSRMMGWNVFYFANFYGNNEGLKYLLNNGADPNLRHNNGQTPLFSCRNEPMINELIEAGADLQIIDNQGLTLIDVNINNCIVANICILEAQGLLKQELTEAIERNSHNDVLQGKLNQHRQDLEWMKTCYISDSDTLFSVLANKVENTSRYGKSDDEVEAIIEVSRERELQPTYSSMILKNLEKANKLYKLRPRGFAFLSNAMKIDPPGHLVIEKIINYLNFQEMFVFDEVDD